MRTWLKIAFWIVISFFIGLRVFATVYYVSATGSDGNNGTSINTPWLSISHVNSIFSTLQPGDQVLFKRGETFYTTTGLQINKSGTLAAPIVIGAYGSGSNPVFTSLLAITGWGAVSGGVAESAAFSALSAGLQIVVVNDAVRPIGRYPDITNVYVGNYLTYEAHTAKTSIRDDQLASSPDWDGAQIVIRSSRWTIDRGLISSHSGTTINYTYYSSNAYEPPAGNGYFIQNHASTLTKFGEWYYNSSTDKIKLYFGAAAPGSTTVQAATATNLVNASGRSYITLDGIEFRGANGSTISATSSTGWRIQNCIIKYNGINGILHSGTNPVFDNNQILYSYNDGMRLNGTTNAKTTNSLINWTYWAAGMGQDGNDQGQGIRNDVASLIQYNTIKNSGFYGVFLGKSGSQVLNNYVDTGVFVKDDGGLIHGYVSHNKPATTSDTRTGQKINDNIALNSLGANAGTSGSASYFNACGIYLDDNSNGYEMKRNFVAGVAGFGIFAHNNFNGTIADNTVYNSGYQMLYVDDNLGTKISSMTNTGNVFFARISSQIVAHYKSNGGTYDNPVQSMGTWTNNFYCRPTNENDIIQITNPGYNNLISLAEWKNLYGKDAGSSGTPATGTLSFVYNETKVDKVVLLSGTFKNARNQTFINTITLPPYTGQVLIQTSAGPSNTSPTVSLTSPTAGQTFTSLADITLTATAADADGTISKVEFYHGGTNLIFTETGAPYTRVWPDVNQGTYSITAKAYDNLGAITTSTAVSVTVNNALPSVTVSSPADNSNFVIPSTTITFDATATDPNGTITNVKFYSNGVLFQTEVNPPYTFTRSFPTAGTYEITAVALDNNGGTTTSDPVTFTVSAAGNASPTVSITAPSDNSTFASHDDIGLSATAADVDGSIASVSFYNGATLLSTDNAAPYTYTWPDVAEGVYIVTARTTDNLGAVTESVPINIVVTNTFPEASITLPLDLSTVSNPADITINATATDNNGTIDEVSFYVGDSLLNTDVSSPYSFIWNDVDTGTYLLTVRAVDNDGAIDTSSVITVTVANVAPTITIDHTVIDGISPGEIQIDATAADENGTITKVDFYADTLLLGTDLTPPYSFTWSNITAGDHVIFAIATDNDGTPTSSSELPITITDGVFRIRLWNIKVK